MIRIDIKRTDFYNELEKEFTEKYFSTKYSKYISAIDNIYYTVFLEADSNDNTQVEPLLNTLDTMKQTALSEHEMQDFGNGLMVDTKSYNLYKYCLTNPDLYDIFVLSYLPNNTTPRICVQIRAYGLWLYGLEKMLIDSYNHVSDVFSKEYGCTIGNCRESRIDYCYHTNSIFNPNKIFSDKNTNNSMQTTMQKYHQIGRVLKKDGKTVLQKDYFSLGQRKSNNVFIRCYNKVLEVIDNGYKGFFFEIWHSQGLISFYDKYCFEYAYKERNYDYVHKAKLQFYLDYGTDETVKKEFALILNNAETPLSEFKTLASQYMPEVSTVINIEFQTMRKFYYYSDKVIDMLECKKRDSSLEPLKRVFKITDNRLLSLDYLTSNTLCYKQKNGNYSDWWKRLRTAKVDGYVPKGKLLREYSHLLDRDLIKKKFVNSVATSAVYGDKIESDFLTDLSDMLSCLNDNHMRVTIFDEAGEVYSDIKGKFFANYRNKKIVKSKRLINRKKIDKQEAE